MSDSAIRTYGPLRHSLLECAATTQPRIIQDLARHITELQSDASVLRALHERCLAQLGVFERAAADRVALAKRQLEALQLVSGLDIDVLRGEEEELALPDPAHEELAHAFLPDPAHEELAHAFLPDPAHEELAHVVVSQPLAPEIELVDDDEGPTLVFESIRPVESNPIQAQYEADVTSGATDPDWQPDAPQLGFVGDLPDENDELSTD